MEIKDNWAPERYGVIDIEPRREIVMIRGVGCFHKQCKFCDYYLDMSTNVLKNYELNKNVLEQVKGTYGELEVICSGSIQEVDIMTLSLIKKIAIEKGITKLSLECHYNYRDSFEDIKTFFAPIKCYFRVGVESFDYNWREKLMNKGMGDVTPEDIREYFEYCNLLIGEEHQTKEQILNDIEIADKYFDRVCIGALDENGKGCKRDEDLINWFVDELATDLRKNPKYHILIENDDFPLGDGSMTEKGDINE